MMQLLCNGVELDLQNGLDLAFQKFNPIFAFDKLQCERSQSFKIPATAHNEQVFWLAKLPAYDGQAMRVKFPCEMRSGYVVKRGYLYVDTYEGGAYNCIFITGELVGLQAIKNLGKLSEIIYVSDTIIVGNSVTNPSYSINFAWANVKYKNDISLCYPSMSIKRICDFVENQNTLPAITYPSGIDGLRLIVPECKLPEGDVGVFDSVVTGSHATSPAQADFINDLSVTKAGVGLWNLAYGTAPNFIYYQSLAQYSYEYYKIRAFRAGADLELKFPEDWDDDVFVCKYRDETTAITTELGLDFLGERYFTKNQNEAAVYHGQSLRGRSVSVAQGDQILFVTADMYENSSTQIGSQTRVIQGWNIRDIEVTGIEVSGGTAAVGMRARLQDNLPDMTFVEILKVLAAMTGTALNYTDADGVTFDPINVDLWGKIEIDGKVIFEKKLTRRFGDYAQRNLVLFKSEPYADRLRTEYTIANDNIASEKVLQEIPFSEGALAYESGIPIIYIKTREGNTDDEMSIADADTTATNLARVSLVKNNNLQTLCGASTEIELQVSMTLAEFEQIGAKVVILYRGTRYVWTEGTWSNRVATLKLSKIG